jgi:phthalate 4,5-cis-dihydrodiol dehydrogenase
VSEVVENKQAEDPRRFHNIDLTINGFGVTFVACEHGDMRQFPDGVFIHGDDKTEVPIGQAIVGRRSEVLELYETVMHGRPVFHTGRWGKATLEVCLAILQSAAERREIQMAHQVAAWE